MKRLFSLLLVFMLVFQTTVLADSGITVEVLKNEAHGQEYEFSIRYNIPEMSKGDSFTLQLPFPVNIDGGDYLEISHMGNGLYQLVAKDDFVNVRGKVGGKKIVEKTSDLNPITVDGSVVLDEFPNIEVGDGPVATERDRIYKLGSADGDIINWEFVIGGDEKGVVPTSIYDEIGDGHELIESSLEFYVLSGGEYDDRLIDMIVDDYETGPDFVELQLNQISAGEMLMVKYQTQITDYSLGEYSNQLIVEDGAKVSETVIIEDFSDIDGDKPSPEPTEPDRPEPEEPEQPPVLPQVGEGMFKIEYGLGLLLLGLAFVIRKK